jgi:drug/metabolite transporter (DMT)-like permease
MQLTRTAAARTDNLHGILAMLAAMMCFVTGDTIVKFAGRELPAGEMMFVRGLFASLLTVSVGIAVGAFRNAHHALTPLMALRTLGDIGATAFFFVAVVRLPFAEVNAIGQFIPLALTAGAAIFLAEPVGWRRWLALLVGLMGVLIIVRPGGNAYDWAAVLVLGSVMCVAVRDLVTRYIGLALPALLLASISAVSVTVGGLLMMPFETWRLPSTEVALLMAGSGVTIFAGNYAMVQAMRMGEVGVVAPFRYAAIPFAVLSGYVVFGELPDAITFLGIAIVMGAGLYTLHRERVRWRRA